MPPEDRIVYVVLAHREPVQVARLVTLLAGSPGSEVVVHWDSDLEITLPVGVRRLPRQRVSWGGFSIPSVFVAGMRAALAAPGVAWVVFLSGQDYPLRPLDSIRQDLLDSPYDVHMDVREVEEGDPWPMWEPLTRYGYRFVFGPVLPAVVRRRLWRAIDRSCRWVQRRSGTSDAKQPWSSAPRVVLRNVGAKAALGIRRSDNPFLPPSALYAGDAWFSVRAEGARAILQALEDDPAYVSYMRHTLVPDEAFFHSLIRNRLPSFSIGPWKRYRVFFPGESHPHTWGASDVPALLGTGADFARKFDVAVDAEVLDLLDSAVRTR